MNILEFIATIKTFQPYPKKEMDGLCIKNLTKEPSSPDCSEKKGSVSNPPLSLSATSGRRSAFSEPSQRLLVRQPPSENK